LPCLDNMSAYDFRDACEAGDLDKAKGLIKSVDINETDEYGFTGLHMAAENGHLKIVEELLAAGAKLDPLVFDSYLLPLHMAINKGHTAIAKLLIEKGAKLDEKSYSGACCAPIHYAILKENQEIFKLLMSKKCDINIPDDINGNSPLFIATTLKQIDTMKALIAAKADVNLADWEGKTPAHFAAYNGFAAELHLLCTSGADVKIKDGENADGVTVAEIADKAKEAAFVEYLKACEGGKVPAKAPEARVREVFVAKEVIPLEGCGEGCANPDA